MKPGFLTEISGEVVSGRGQWLSNLSTSNHVWTTRRNYCRNVCQERFLLQQQCLRGSTTKTENGFIVLFFSLCWKLSLLKRSRNTHSVCFPNDVSKSQIAARIVLCFSCQSVLVRDVWGTFSTLFWLLWDWRRGETLMDTTQDKHKQLEIHQTNANLCDRLSVFNALYCMIL